MTADTAPTLPPLPVVAYHMDTGDDASWFEPAGDGPPTNAVAAARALVYAEDATALAQRVAELESKLRKEALQAFESEGSWIELSGKQLKRIEALEMENERLRPNAERYEFLRSGAYSLTFAQTVLNDTPNGIDKRVDAFIAARKGDQHG